MWKSHALVLQTIFILTALFLPENGGTNAASRMAQMRAIVESRTLSISNYKHWTIDWAMTPDGKYYSNKAPGGALLGLPLFGLMDLVTWPLDSALENEVRRGPRSFYGVVLSFFLQVLPFCFLFGSILKILGPFNNSGKSAISSEANDLQMLLYFGLAFLFGNTAAILMNTFTGHGLAAVCLVACKISMIQKRWALAGLCFGWSALTDYGVFFVLPAFALAFGMMSRWDVRGVAQGLKGALIPGLIFAIYHWICFGAAWVLPSKFQNPAFVDLAQEQKALWGVIRAWPEPKILLELLFGFERGLLWTQPWVLVLPFFIFQNFKVLDSKKRAFSIFALGGLFGLLLMNAAFGGWHGGASPGPRYLSPIIPCLAVCILFVWPHISKNAKAILKILILYSIGFRVLVALGGHSASWDEFIVFYYIERLAHVEAIVRLAVLMILLGMVYWAWKKSLYSKVS